MRLNQHLFLRILIGCLWCSIVVSATPLQVTVEHGPGLSLPYDKDMRKHYMDSLLKVCPTDTAARKALSFDAYFKSKYSDEDFDYLRDNPNSGMMDRLLKKLYNLLKKLLAWDDENHLSDTRIFVLKALAAILILIVLYFVVRIVMNHKGKWFFEKKSEDLTIDINNAEQLIQHADFEELIAASEKAGDTRQSIRLYYLWLLRILDEKQLIVWTPEKTNADYLRELEKAVARDKFEYFSYLFNYVWYGEFEISEAEYQTARTAFLAYLRREVMYG